MQRRRYDLTPDCRTRPECPAGTSGNSFNASREQWNRCPIGQRSSRKLYRLRKNANSRHCPRPRWLERRASEKYRAFAGQADAGVHGRGGISVPQADTRDSLNRRRGNRPRRPRVWTRCSFHAAGGSGTGRPPTIPVLQHAVSALASLGEIFDAVVVLQPTTPLRQPEDIDGAIELLFRSGADSVISFVEVGDSHPARMKVIDRDGRVLDPPFAEACEGQRRQDLPMLYLRAGSVYVTRTSVLMEQNSLKGSDCRAWVIPPDRACNVDTPFDLFLAEQMLRFRNQCVDVAS